MVKGNDEQVLLICEPCKKKYKTKNGLAYHLERCKYKFTESNDIVNCICQDATDGNKGSMIECVACSTWLHRKCVGSVTGEKNYHCIRCATKATINGNLVKFSEIFPKVIEESTECPYISLYFERRPINTPWKNSIIRSCTVDAFNDLWANTPCDPSLFPSLNLSPSPSPELSSSNLLPQSDWFHFANFEVDYYQL